jgi:hypothetical protein
MTLIEVAMSKARLLLAVLALTVASAPSLIARGNAVTIRLDITGGRLTQPLSITERALLDLSGVYPGKFLGEITNAVDPTWSRYAVTFVSAPQIPTASLPPDSRKTYVAVYTRNPATDEGFVYLPGRGEDGYRINISMMIRDGHDGRWHRAHPEWATLLNSYLPRD